MYELLGPHVNQTYGGIPEMVARWKPAVALVLDHGPVWHWVKEQSPKTILVGRWFHGEPPDFEKIDPVKHAREQLAPILKQIAASPYDYIAGDNEPVIHSRKAMHNLALYDIERMIILKRVGKKAAIGGFAAGNPPNMAHLDMYMSAMRAGVAYGAVLHLHQYDWPEIGANDVWLSYRHELFYDGCLEHDWPGVSEDLRIPIIITEFGLDYGTQKPGIRVGWRGADLTPAGYNYQLEEGNKRLMKSHWVVGACIFCVGNASGKWVMYDYWPEIVPLSRQATPVYRRPEWFSPDDILGIDVSYWQPSNFPFKEAVDDDGLDFVIIRSSFKTVMDGRFKIHWRRSHEAGIRHHGIYHYLYPGNIEAQAAKFAAIALKYPCNLGYFADVEDRGLNKASVELFKRTFECISGKKLDYYSSGYLWSKIVGRSAFLEQNGMKWVADWRNLDRFAVPAGFKRKEVKIRQITSNNGYISSYDGRLDINKWIGDPGEFWALR